MDAFEIATLIRRAWNKGHAQGVEDAKRIALDGIHTASQEGFKAGFAAAQLAAEDKSDLFEQRQNAGLN